MVHASHAVSLRKAAFHKHSSGGEKIVWVEMDSNLEMRHLHTVLLSENLPSKQSTPVQHGQKYNVNTDNNTAAEQSKSAHCDLQKTNSDKNPATGIQQEVQGGELSQMFTTQHVPKQASKVKVVKMWVSGMLTKSIKAKNLSVFDPILLDSIESSQDALTMHQPGDILNIVTLLDTGGQPQYIHLLPTINIHPTVNFVIHDLTKSLDDQVLVEYSEHGKHTFQPYHLSYTNLDMVKLLVSSLNDCLEMSSQAPQLITHPGPDKNSHLCFVGTHADKVTREVIQNTAKVLKATIRKTDCKASVLQNEDGSILFPVDNTTAGNKIREDPVADIIRNKIERIAENKNVYELPITWMLLELEIRQVCTKNNKLYVSVSECVAIAKHSRLMSSSEEVKNALMYHHLLGVLIFFQEIPGLQDYVIIDHQWWFDKLSNIISLTFKEHRSCSLEFHELKYKGILSKDILQKVKWEGDIKEEYFLLLLCHLKIVAPLHTNKDEYFIPYILPAYTIQQRDVILQRYGDIQGEPLLIQFKSGILPRGLFCCLIVHLLQNPPLEWKPHFTEDDDYHVFSNLITFSLPNAFSLSLLDKVSYLEAQIRHKVIRFTTTTVPVHFDARHKITEALSIVCKQLNFNFERVQVGFFCRCGKCFEPHIAVVPSDASAPRLFATCSANSVNQLQLASSHLVWFDESVTSKLGEIIFISFIFYNMYQVEYNRNVTDPLCCCML